MAILRKPALIITFVAGATTANVKVNGEIEFSPADRYLMDSAFPKRVFWYNLVATLWGKDSQEGSTDTNRHWLGAKLYPEAATTLQNTPYSFDVQVPISVLNEDPEPGAKDELYAKVFLANLFAGTNKEAKSDTVEHTFP